MEQLILEGAASVREAVRSTGASRLLLVCGRSFDRLSVRDEILSLDADLVRFSDFSPNPLYEDAAKATDLFRREGCGAILAVGGGSAMDVAKCVKLYAPMDPSVHYLQQEYRDSGIPLIAMPATAGTGSESTQHAVIYDHGEKQSVSHPSIRPDTAVLDPSALDTLPLYQKKCALLDALCQGIESWWSVRSTEESRAHARAAVTGILAGYRDYLGLSDDSAAYRSASWTVLRAANQSGQAIHLTATTAPHAMSYKLTSLYGLPHGHAVALCMGPVWAYTLSHTGDCADPRGEAHLRRTLAEISEVITPDRFRELLSELDMERVVSRSREELVTLAKSVNPLRLGNHPVAMDEGVLLSLYREVFLI